MDGKAQPERTLSSRLASSMRAAADKPTTTQIPSNFWLNPVSRPVRSPALLGNASERIPESGSEVSEHDEKLSRENTR